MSEAGKRIRTIRESKGMMVRFLAEKVGITPSYMSRIETGAHKSPGLPTIEKIAEVLNVTPNQILFGESKNLNAVMERLPADIQEWLTNTDIEPYISIAKKLYEMKIPPVKFILS